MTLKSRADGTSGKILKGERGHGGPFRSNANELLGDICTAAAAATKEKCIYSLRVYKRLKKYETAHTSLWLLPAERDQLLRNSRLGERVKGISRSRTYSNREFHINMSLV